MNVEEIDDVAELEFVSKSYKIKVKELACMEEEEVQEEIMEVHNQFSDDQPPELATTAEAGNDKEINTDRANDSDWVGEYNSCDVCFQGSRESQTFVKGSGYQYGDSPKNESSNKEFSNYSANLKKEKRSYLNKKGQNCNCIECFIFRQNVCKTSETKTAIQLDKEDYIYECEVGETQAKTKFKVKKGTRGRKKREEKKRKSQKRRQHEEHEEKPVSKIAKRLKELLILA